MWRTLSSERENSCLRKALIVKEMTRDLFFRAARSISITFILVLSLIFTAGCGVVVQRFKVEVPFTAKKVEEISRGKTTKAELLEWFGPPSALVRKDERVEIPINGSKGPEHLPGESFFEPFDGRHESTPGHIVYYYQSFYIHNEIVFFVEAGIPTPLREVYNKVWILIDDESSLVVDYILELGKGQGATEEEDDDDYEYY